MTSTAGEVFVVRMQVGRWLHGPALATAVVLRNVLLMLLSAGIVDYVAPAWAVVSRRDTGEEVGRVPLGRDAVAGQAEFSDIQASLALPPPEFLLRLGLDD